jgi:hypothetical protein
MSFQSVSEVDQALESLGYHMHEITNGYVANRLPINTITDREYRVRWSRLNQEYLFTSKCIEEVLFFSRVLRSFVFDGV